MTTGVREQGIGGGTRDREEGFHDTGVWGAERDQVGRPGREEPRERNMEKFASGWVSVLDRVQAKF